MAKRAAKRVTARKPRRARAKRAVVKTAARRKSAARATAARARRKKAAPSTFAKAAALARGAAAGVVAAVARRIPWAKNENDPIALLETDHRRFEQLLKQGEETTERAAKGRTELLDTLAAELTVHEAIEEKILYPVLKAHAEAREQVLEGYQEHHIADVIVKELGDLAKSDERWGAKFKVLKENIEHHIKEEEHDMFPTARAVLSTAELTDLGVRMKKLKAELES